MSATGDQEVASFRWTTTHYQQERVNRMNRKRTSLLRPSVFAACLAIAGRVVLGPLAVLLLFTATDYLADATFLIEVDRSFFLYTQRDLSMAGSCTDCEALTSLPGFSALVGHPPTESLYDFSTLSGEAIALGEELDNSGAICQSGINDWGAITSILTATPQEVLDVIRVLNLNVPPQTVQELELGVEHADECVTNWSILAIVRLFYFPTSLSTREFGKISAGAINVFPEYSECRPEVTVDVGSKLVHSTDGVDLFATAPDALKLFPYSFTSSMPAQSRVVAASQTKYGATTVLEPQMHAYYGDCRVREVNATGIYIESSCNVSEHWESYGLMVQAPENVPLCSTGGVCIRNYFNTEWELMTNILSTEKSTSTAIYQNTYRTRYADSVGISTLPGVVVMQILFMGVVSLYQVMSHKRSVLLTQIWAYRCQNGRMQPVYLAQISYHFFYNSDLYLLGFATGTLTNESIANLVCCFFAFSYSFVNMAKARSGDQKLDREFRLVWEAMQIAITVAAVVALKWVQSTPLATIISDNAQILRKSSTLGAKYCGLNDSCIVFTVNMIVVAIFA
ncbi:hypothetical protein PHYSODRAFT_335362 [Phytophthora sojae]|uniref:Transmembrane protein n=1 Tax=Phytophthora sojae (strain P6497) TaxID=1094619 RepID=G4ZUX9_PHYSP|nr:hypothetical protein PHYSODRAFT_335362 [Phytophthora sojae]EGZ13603.1 hypothetical protein PHYSODRAFT_335362 [Phytophthora sojae]|eukprot:XP_009531032.1 hypothetical protein PHYSODRAFT_335362 [Phytophthora sojae]